MKRSLILVLGLTSCLAACDQGPSSPGAGRKDQGRYSGIGIYEAGRLWAQTKGAPAATANDTARLEDDEHVIVIVDTHSGEVRQCGDHSGICVAMKPWSNGNPLFAAPVRLEKHASELDAEAAKELETSNRSN